MKKLLIVMMGFVILFGLSNSVLAYPPSVDVNAYSNGCRNFDDCISSADHTYLTDVVVVDFDTTGEYEFSILDGAFTSWNALPNGKSLSYKEWFWTVNIYNPQTDDDKMLGNNTESFDWLFNPGGDDQARANAQNSSNPYSNPVVKFDLTAGDSLWFYVMDYDPRSNGGDLGTKDADMVVGVNLVPEPISTTLFIVGGMLLGGRSYLRRKKK